MVTETDKLVAIIKAAKQKKREEAEKKAKSKSYLKGGYKQSKKVLVSYSKKMLKKGGTKKAGGAIQKIFTKGKREATASLRIAAMNAKNRQLQIQMQRERNMQAENLAAQQRASYEEPFDESFAYLNQPQEQFVEDEYGRVQKPSFTQSMAQKLKPNPGILQRLKRTMGLDESSEESSEEVPQQSSQVGTRHVFGEGPLMRAPSIMGAQQLNAPRLTLLGGNQIVQQQPNILNTRDNSFARKSISSPEHNLKW